jgi:hypothetical protein
VGIPDVEAVDEAASGPDAGGGMAVLAQPGDDLSSGPPVLQRFGELIALGNLGEAHQDLVLTLPGTGQPCG